MDPVLLRKGKIGEHRLGVFGETLGGPRVSWLQLSGELPGQSQCLLPAPGIVNLPKAVQILFLFGLGQLVQDIYLRNFSNMEIINIFFRIKVESTT